MPTTIQPLNVATAQLPATPLIVARHVGVMLVTALPRLLDGRLVYRPVGPLPRGTQALIGWGLKGKFAAAAAQAKRSGLPYLAVEDGFLRSVGLGGTDAALALSFDDLGVYYDARCPSRLEQQIATPHDTAQHTRGSAVAASWRQARLSKYNHAREAPPPVAGPFVLVVDQTFGDMSIEMGLAGSQSFQHMLEAALDEHPQLPVVLKVHPDVIAGRKRAHFDRLPTGVASRVVLLASDAHPPPLLEAAQSVYVVTSQMGFEALIWGRPVRCFGMPFYGGWGLTHDELPAPARRRTATPTTLEGLVHAALVEYPRYLDPETGARCEVERLIEWMALQRRQRERNPANVQALKFSEWKKPIARVYFGGSELAFVDELQPLPKGGMRSVWGRPANDEPAAQATDGPLLRVEDGFLRSVGLGADWIWPLSWVIDRSGIYYDATAPSDLERLLQVGDCDEALLARARALRDSVVAAGVTKYNVGGGTWRRPAVERTVVLVPGQVESDRSIAYGSPALHRNVELLRAVRAARPNSHIVYKPHPDVLAGKRTGEMNMGEVESLCDEIVTDVPMHRLLDEIDELHTLTSLAGFEALMRGKHVVCHGLPFYAGWGLTEDRLVCPRRTRRLTLDELVAGALVLYPTYASRISKAYCTPERALYELTHWHALQLPAEPRVLRLLRWLKRWRERSRVR